MMEVFRPLVAEGFEWLSFDSAASASLVTLRGGRVADDWKPVVGTPVRVDGRRRLVESDFPWFMGSVLIMRQRAVERLRPFWDANGELLPLSTSDGASLFAFNSQLVNGLDEAKSRFARFSDGRIMTMYEVSFIAEAISGKDLFRLSTWPGSTFVSGEFVQAYSAAGLKGLTFIPQWSGGG